jgi:hypothetical protein
LNRLAVTLAAASAIAGCASRPPLIEPVKHSFELLSHAPHPSDPGADDLPCLYGKHPAGVSVLLLSDTDSTTCVVTTGRTVPAMFNGECTMLAGMEGCRGSHSLGVIGSRGAYRRVEPREMAGGSRATLTDAIAKGRVAEAAASRWKEALSNVRLRPEIREAWAWPDLDGTPVLVRLAATGDTDCGPWVAIAAGAAGTMVGPFSMQVPSAFILDGRSYLAIPFAVCTDCGGVGTEVHAVEGGRLRPVLQSLANAN